MHSSPRSSPYCPPLPFQPFLSLQHTLRSVWRVLYGIQKLSTTPFKRARAQADRPPRSRVVKHLAKIGLLYYSPPLCPHMSCISILTLSFGYPRSLLSFEPALKRIAPVLVPERPKLPSSTPWRCYFLKTIGLKAQCAPLRPGLEAV